MRTKVDQTGVSRKVVAYYLFFCMIAVVWLSVGVLTTTHSVISNRTTNGCLARLGQLASAVEMDMLRAEGKNIQTLVERAQVEGRLTYCSIVDTEGRYLAHTTRPLVGAPMIEPTGSRLRWGAVEGIRYSSDAHGMLSEYRTPLVVGGETVGSLRLGVAEPEFFNIFSEVTEVAPLAILLPLGCVAAGAFLLRRLVSPIVSVEQQLSQIARTPLGTPLPIQSVATTGVASTGWNRLVEQFSAPQETSADSSLNQRIAQAVTSRRRGQSLDVLNGLHDGVAVTDVEGRIEFANAAIASLLGLEAESDLKQAALIDALAGVTNEPERVAGLQTKTPVVKEFEATSHGHPRALRVERQPLDEGHGRAIWSIRDVTQQKMAEKSRDQFIDAATHELRTPLANIKAYAETLALCDLDDAEQQKEFCNTINTEATRLARFVDDLLDISSMEVGSLTIRRQNVDIERLLREAASKVQPVMQKKSQEFDLVLPPKLGEMSLDKDKVSALIVNLLGNASKYTPEGGRVRFKADLSEDALKLTVADTGVGIAPNELPKVFEKFFRSEDPTVRGEAGTGLGLSLAREIARLHGGDVTAESTHGEGSTFTILLPRTKSTAGGES